MFQRILESAEAGDMTAFEEFGVMGEIGEKCWQSGEGRLTTCVVPREGCGGDGVVAAH